MGQYSQPSAGGDKFEPNEHLGHLLLFFPIRYTADEPTKFGPTTSANADIIDIDTGQFMSDAKVFGNLANSLRQDVGGGKVLGRLGQGQNTKGNPPWVLLSFDEATDPQRADPYTEKYLAGQYRQPQGVPPQAQQPTPNPQGHAAPTPPAAAPAAQPTWGNSAPVPPAATPQAGWNAPAAPPAPAPAQPPAPAIDPNLVSFLASKGVQVTPDMTQATAEAIARSFPT